MPSPLRALRRVAVVVGVAGVVGTVLRLCSQGGDPQHAPAGGWRELRGPDFR